MSLGNYASVWLCRWCGYPVFADSAWSQPEFHRGCYNRYNDVLRAYFALGWIQFCLVVVGGALCWRYFRDDRMVLIPSIVSQFEILGGVSAPSRMREGGESARGWYLFVSF